jgi:hypothetical protein
MASGIERRLWQGAVVLACCVPLFYGLQGVARGPGWLKGVVPGSTDLDSHFRYLSGIFLGVGIAFASCIPAMECKGPRFRMLGGFVVLGGLARLASLLAVGAPSSGHVFGLGMELGVVPLLMLWQARIARGV